MTNDRVVSPSRVLSFFTDADFDLVDSILWKGNQIVERRREELLGLTTQAPKKKGGRPVGSKNQTSRGTQIGRISAEEEAGEK